MGQKVCQYDGQSLVDTYETKWENGGEFKKFKCRGAKNHFYWIPTGLRNKPLPNNIYSNPNSGSDALDQLIGQLVESSPEESPDSKKTVPKKHKMSEVIMFNGCVIVGTYLLLLVLDEIIVDY